MRALYPVKTLCQIFAVHRSSYRHWRGRTDEPDAERIIKCSHVREAWNVSGGSAFSLTADADLVCHAMRNALETRPCDGRLLFHSDQGVQYKSNKYRRLLCQHSVIQSMSRRGNCLDNSPMERVFRNLKSEWIPKGGYGDFSYAVRDINQWINGYYNIYRPHTKNGELPLCLHEEKWKQVIPVL